MPKGTSGRVVIEMDPQLKSDLYAMLSLQGMTMKEWFMQNVTKALDDGPQLPLAFSEGLNQDGE
ncbi:hypothetical protein Ga0123462_0852 [Mariprofundus ferrinatatus]|uniref:Uncharacterized protein n=1 Tax=Mariprofundus ferrinatatus TaxID=1921087 RepID=A0A2K8L785_9PROT|nr:hypothetical protein [Mariprofundus ferrinatatus]ATX81721.1 hypothetical protein Ga0123462_0852 [Mariprofundus ferrinatatus]